MATAEPGRQGDGTAGQSKLEELRKRLARKLHEQAAAAKELNDMLTSPVRGAAAEGQAQAAILRWTSLSSDALPTRTPA